MLPHEIQLAIGTIMCPSVCDAVYCGIQGRSGVERLYRCVPTRALPIHFFRQTYCRKYRLTTKYSDRLKYWQASKADFRLKMQISKYSWWPRLFNTMVCSYTASHMEYDQLSQQQLSFLITTAIT